MDTLRESAFGQIIRLVSRRKLFRYPEEEPGFEVPFERALKEEAEESDIDSGPTALQDQANATQFSTAVDVEKAEANHSSDANTGRPTLVKSQSRLQGGSNPSERLEIERELEIQRTLSAPIQPVVTSSGQVLVTWYTTDDPANPQNWSSKKKSYVAFLIWYTPL